MTIGEVSARVGVSPQTLRVWEAKGLLTPDRTSGGQRRYSAEHLRLAEQIADLRRTTGWNPAAIKVGLGAQSSGSAVRKTWNGATPRQARLARGWTIKETAERAGISPSYLSAIERDETPGSTKVVAQLADAFNMPMSGLGRFTPGEGLVVRREDRASGEFDGGVVWEELARPGHRLEPALLTVPGGQDSGGTYVRPGESFVLILAGSLTFSVVGQADEIVGKGDAIMLPADTAFSWANPRRAKARAVWVEQLPADAWRSPEAAKLVARLNQEGS